MGPGNLPKSATYLFLKATTILNPFFLRLWSLGRLQYHVFSGIIASFRVRMPGRSYIGLEALLYRPEHTQWQLFITSPFKYLVSSLYGLQQQRHALNRRCGGIQSSLHLRHHKAQPKVPYGDTIIHAGDPTQGGTIEEMSKALSWLSTLPHPRKVKIAENHDTCLKSEDKSQTRLDRYYLTARQLS